MPRVDSLVCVCWFVCWCWKGLYTGVLRHGMEWMSIFPGHLPRPLHSLIWKARTFHWLSAVTQRVILANANFTRRSFAISHCSQTCVSACAFLYCMLLQECWVDAGSIDAHCGVAVYEFLCGWCVLNCSGSQQPALVTSGSDTLAQPFTFASGLLFTQL